LEAPGSSPTELSAHLTRVGFAWPVSKGLKVISIMRSRLIPIGLLTVLCALPLFRSRASRLGTLPGPDAPRVPVLVELFTSEACSSCPPGDALLQKLDRSQPVPNAAIVVLSENVDYWDDFRWKDPFSSPAFTARQNDYARRFRLGGTYTPQMVVDGDKEFVGSDEPQAIHVIGNAVKAAKLPVTLSAIRLEDKNVLTLHIDAEPLDLSRKHPTLQVILALADESDQSTVRGGENGGRILTHVAVVRKITQVGTTDRTGVFSKDVKVSIEKANPHNLRIVAIVQEPAVGRVLGLATARLAD
jgi:hypothetical protein